MKFFKNFMKKMKNIKISALARCFSLLLLALATAATAGRIQFAHRLAYGRAATPLELQEGATYIRKQAAGLGLKFA